jgi:uncharacterized protein involved in outer membrane biogenesis
MLRFLVGFLWSVFICVLVLAALSLVINLDSLKPQIEAQATELLQQKVHINGDISPGVLGWHPALVMHKVDIGAKVKADMVALTVQSLRSSREFLVHANGLSFGDTQLGDYDIPVIIQATGFEIYPLRGVLEGSELAAEVRYTDHKLHIDGVLKDLPLGKLAEEAEGKVEVKLQLDSKGDDLAQLRHALAGRFTLTGGEGKLTSKSLNFWSRGLLSSLLPGQKKETRLNCAIIDFKMESGIAVSRAIIVDTSENTVFGKGSIDLDKGSVDMVLRPNPKDMSLVSFATPVHVTGPVDAAVVTPEAGGVAKKIGGILLGVVNPALALLPLMETGFDDYHGSCADILKQKQPKKAP